LVSLRFKQVFSGIASGTVPTFTLRDTPDRARDLDWFMSRYPLRMSPQTEARLRGSVAAYEAGQDRVARLLSGDYVPPTLAGIREPERADPHQVRAATLLRETGRLLLLDEVGLGKTVSALTAIADGWGLPAIIVVQPHIADQWIGFIERFNTLRAVQVKTHTPHKLDQNELTQAPSKPLYWWGSPQGCPLSPGVTAPGHTP
jgi:hypothetical protein